MMHLAVVTLSVMALMMVPVRVAGAVGGSGPSGAALLRLTRQALLAEKTVRISQTARSTSTNTWDFSVSWTDVDLATNAMRSVSSIQRVHPRTPHLTMTVERLIQIAAGGRFASKSPGNAWQCESYTGRLQDGLEIFQLRAPTIQNLGSVIVDGRPAWHVQAVHAVMSAWSTNDATVDLFIAQAGDRLLRLTLHAAPYLGGKIVREYVSESFRRYGKPVTPTLPRPCR